MLILRDELETAAAITQTSNVITVPSGTSILFSNGKSKGLMNSLLYTLASAKTYSAATEAGALYYTLGWTSCCFIPVQYS